MIAFLKRGFARMLSLLNPAEADRDLQAEISAHVDFAIEENQRKGMAAEEARRQAMIRFGTPELAKDQHRDARGLPLIDVVGADLAALGIYGVVSYSVTQRTQEIGIRMALGATPGKVQASVLSDTLLLVLAGIGTGALASLFLARLIASLLFGTAPTDPISLAGTVILLGLTAFTAASIPAGRASHVDPLVALRNE